MQVLHLTSCLIYNIAMKKQNNKTTYYADRCDIPLKKGNGTLSFSFVQDENGSIVDYSFAYINHQVCSKDNGRVLGYDNSHGEHHRHIMGKYEKVDFISFDDTKEKFEKEWREFHATQQRNNKGR